MKLKDLINWLEDELSPRDVVYTISDTQKTLILTHLKAYEQTNVHECAELEEIMKEQAVKLKAAQKLRDEVELSVKETKNHVGTPERIVEALAEFDNANE